MPDRFDVQRGLDNAGEALVQHAMDGLEAGKEKARERRERLIRLDEEHYFDPLERKLLFKVGEEFRDVGHIPEPDPLPAAALEDKATKQGYTTVEGGGFWDPTLRHLYVKNGSTYLLYALHKREPPSPAFSGS